MKKILLILLAFSFVGCDRFEVDQEIRRNAVTNEREFATWVFEGSELLYVWKDPVEGLTDSIIKLRQRQADSLVKKAKTFR